MRAWGRQGFLNPAHSNDDGWFKFSIRPFKKPIKNHLWSEGSVLFVISDCSNKISLDFDVNTFSSNSEGKINSDTHALRLAEVKERRKKIRLFVDAVTKAGEKIEEYLDEMEDYLEGVDTYEPE